MRNLRHITEIYHLYSGVAPWYFLPQMELQWGTWEWPLFLTMASHFIMFYLFYLYFIKFNSWRPWRNRRYNADDIFKCIFLRENVWIPNKISLKFVPKGPINNIPAMVQIMAWRRPGDKPLSEPMMVSLLTHTCVTRPQWFNMCSTWSHLRAVHVCNIFIILGHAVMSFKKNS